MHKIPFHLWSMKNLIKNITYFLEIVFSNFFFEKTTLSHTTLNNEVNRQYEIIENNYISFLRMLPYIGK